MTGRFSFVLKTFGRRLLNVGLSGFILTLASSSGQAAVFSGQGASKPLAKFPTQPGTYDLTLVVGGTSRTYHALRIRCWTTDEATALDMIKRNQRVPGGSKILDRILALNQTSGTFLYNTINEHAIGVVGHSYGGETVLGLIGAHPDAAMDDHRIQAAIILSGAVFPFQDTLQGLKIPLMVMQGDDGDDLDLHGSGDHP